VNNICSRYQICDSVLNENTQICGLGIYRMAWESLYVENAVIIVTSLPKECNIFVGCYVYL